MRGCVQDEDRIAAWLSLSLSRSWQADSLLCSGVGSSSPLASLPPLLLLCVCACVCVSGVSVCLSARCCCCCCCFIPFTWSGVWLRPRYFTSLRLNGGPPFCFIFLFILFYFSLFPSLPLVSLSPSLPPSLSLTPSISLSLPFSRCRGCSCPHWVLVLGLCPCQVRSGCLLLTPAPKRARAPPPPVICSLPHPSPTTT